MSAPNLDCRIRNRNMRKTDRMLRGHPALHQQFLEDVVRTLTREVDEIEARLNAAQRRWRLSRMQLIQGGRRI